MRVERILSMLLTDPVTQVEVVVSSDKAIRAQILESIGPGKSRKGDSVKIELLEDFTTGEHLIAPKGSRVVTEVSEVIRPGAFGRPGEVKLELKYLQILGPEEPKIKITDRLGGRGEKNIAAAAGASIVGGILLGPLGLATGLLIRGDSLDVDSGAQFHIEMAEMARLSVYPIPTGLKKDDASGGDSGSSPNNSDSEVIYIPN